VNERQTELTISALECAREALAGELGKSEVRLAILTIRLRITSLKSDAAFSETDEKIKLAALTEALQMAEGALSDPRITDLERTLAYNLIELRIWQLRREMRLSKGAA